MAELKRQFDAGQDRLTKSEEYAQKLDAHKMEVERLEKHMEPVPGGRPGQMQYTPEHQALLKEAQEWSTKIQRFTASQQFLASSDAIRKYLPPEVLANKALMDSLGLPSEVTEFARALPEQGYDRHRQQALRDEIGPTVDRQANHFFAEAADSQDDYVGDMFKDKAWARFDAQSGHFLRSLKGYTPEEVRVAIDLAVESEALTSAAKNSDSWDWFSGEPPVNELLDMFRKRMLQRAQNMGLMQ